EAIPPRRHLPPLAKLGLEMGPLVLFFLANAFGERLGLDGDQVTYAAIALFVGATIVSLGIHFALLRRVPIMPLVSGVVVL
ncbi:septation protein IspZ, partial [Lacticaseibacillus rhamnosus]|uniref:septation protein IspZ n=1 Tax=Lacticaseibacillus rhamnosus TaxID=47715 RepID=UPI003F48EAA8